MPEAICNQANGNVLIFKCAIVYTAWLQIWLDMAYEALIGLGNNA